MPYDRSGARAGQDVILSIYFTQNGTPANVFSIGSVSIYDPNSTLISTVDSGDIANPATGLYRITYSLSESAEEGVWRDVWNDIKFTSIAEYVSSTNFFWVVPETQVIPGSATTTVHTYVREANGNNKVGIYGYAELIDPPYYKEGVYFANPTSRGLRATSDSNGKLSWILPQGARVRFRIPDLDMVVEKTIQDSGTETELYDLGGI